MKQFNLEEYLKNPNKKVVTRDGRKVRVICTDYYGKQSIIAKVEKADYSYSFCEDGRRIIGDESPCDLFFATERKEGWANLYNRGNIDYIGCVYTSKEEAEENKGNKESYVATVKIEWEE